MFFLVEGYRVVGVTDSESTPLPASLRVVSGPDLLKDEVWFNPETQAVEPRPIPPSPGAAWDEETNDWQEPPPFVQPIATMRNWDGLKSDFRNGPLFALGYEIASQPGYYDIKAAWAWLTDAVNGRIDSGSEESLKQVLAHPEMGILGRMFRAGIGLTAGQGEAINTALKRNGFFELDYVIEGGTISTANIVVK